jgi:hypothetical protein
MRPKQQNMRKEWRMQFFFLATMIVGRLRFRLSKSGGFDLVSQSRCIYEWALDDIGRYQMTPALPSGYIKNSVLYIRNYQGNV